MVYQLWVTALLKNLEYVDIQIKLVVTCYHTYNIQTLIFDDKMDMNVAIIFTKSKSHTSVRNKLKVELPVIINLSDRNRFSY